MQRISESLLIRTSGGKTKIKNRVPKPKVPQAPKVSI
jgi:hypothetical protein